MNPYIPILLLFGFGAVFTGGFLLLSHLLGPSKHSPEKDMTYECGLNPIGTTRGRFPVKFYLVAMLFIIFDIEVVFLYPWAVLFKEFIASGMGLFVFVEMTAFLAILVVGLLYVYGRRAIDWK